MEYGDIIQASSFEFAIIKIVGMDILLQDVIQNGYDLDTAIYCFVDQAKRMDNIADLGNGNFEIRF